MTDAELSREINNLEFISLGRARDLVPVSGLELLLLARIVAEQQRRIERLTAEVERLREERPLSNQLGSMYAKP